MTRPKRIQQKRVKGWRMPPGARSVARPGLFGNPYRVGATYPNEGLHEPLTQAAAVDAYRAWITGDSVGAQFIRARAVAELRGQDLACWCAPGTPCHADVLLEIINSPED